MKVEGRRGFGKKIHLAIFPNSPVTLPPEKHATAQYDKEEQSFTAGQWGELDPPCIWKPSPHLPYPPPLLSHATKQGNHW